MAMPLGHDSIYVSASNLTVPGFSVIFGKLTQPQFNTCQEKTCISGRGDPIRARLLQSRICSSALQARPEGEGFREPRKGLEAVAIVALAQRSSRLSRR